MPGLVEVARRHATLWTHRIHALPVVVLMPHSRCNCRCVMCDIWRANQRREEIAPSELARHMHDFERLGVRSVVLSGGEPLMHSNLWALVELLATRGISVTLLSTGLLLRRHADEVVRWCDEVIVSLDGDRAVHDRIRGTAGAFDALVDGVTALRERDPGYRVTGRCVIQRLNCRGLAGVVDAARTAGLDRISFLAIDVATTAFNRPAPWDAERVSEVALGPEDARALATGIERVIAEAASRRPAGFIAESPARLRELARHFLAANGLDRYPRRRCNAPWVSTVVEADGTVRPCFFHAPLGNLDDAPLDAILNSARAVAFRKGLDVSTDDICRTCVCTLHRSPWAEV